MCFKTVLKKQTHQLIGNFYGVQDYFGFTCIITLSQWFLTKREDNLSLLQKEKY